jgi:uncharacterized protein (UPF0332 family)
MSLDWADVLLYAEKLATYAATLAQTDKEKEIVQRTAINRAYYSAFKKAEEFLILKNEIDPIKKPNPNRQAQSEDVERVGSHWRVIRMFKQSRSPDRKRIGFLLQSLKFYRENADYNNPYETTIGIEKELEDVLHKARTVLTYLKYVPGEPRRN